MDNNTITYAGTIDPLVGVQAAGMLLAVAQPQMISQRFATQETMKSNAGDTIKWRRYSPWAPATSPLTEGVAPTKQPLVKTDYTAVIRDYANLRPGVSIRAWQSLRADATCSRKPPRQAC